MSDQVGGDENQERTQAEWATLLVSLGIILAAFAAIAYLYVTEENDPIMLHVEARLEEVREAENAYYVPIEVTNRGDAAASNVQITADLRSGDEVESSGFSLIALAGNDTETGIIAFTRDPREGEFTVRVTSYIE